MEQIPWTTQFASFNVVPLNMNVGVEGVTIDADFETSYTYLDSGGIQKTNRGLASTVLPSFDEEEGLKRKLPKIVFKEPLKIEMEVEALDGEFPRDGVTSVNIVATITWKNELITNKFIPDANKPNEFINFPFPVVDFTAGTCKKENADKDGKVIDGRGPSSACLEIKSHPNVNLSESSVSASISRTDIYDNDENSHTHSCTVDSNGNGQTTGTIVLKGFVAPHSHEIKNFVAESGTNGHSHSLRCVAITTLEATSNTEINIAVNGMATYDPTNALPINNEPQIQYKNRKAFNTVRADGYTPSRPELIVEIVSGNNLLENEPNESDVKSGLS